MRPAVLAVLFLTPAFGCGASQPAESAPPPLSAEVKADEPAADAVPAVPGHCFAYVTDDKTWSNCFADQAACDAGLQTIKDNIGDGAGDCVLEQAPFCATAHNAAAELTYRSCASNAEICGEQAKRAKKLIASGMIAGTAPSCAPATKADIERDPGGKLLPG